jgi:PEP-CTERM motif
MTGLGVIGTVVAVMAMASPVHASSFVVDAYSVFLNTSDTGLRLYAADVMVFATAGSRVVDVSFKLLRQDTPVGTPEPGSMVLLGTGLICAASRLRSRQRTSPA